ncbi:hypothetical protein D3C85_1407070 [compost metagenome]
MQEGLHSCCEQEHKRHESDTYEAWIDKQNRNKQEPPDAYDVAPGGVARADDMEQPKDD